MEVLNSEGHPCFYLMAIPHIDLLPICGRAISVKVLASCSTASPSLSARESSAPLCARNSAVARPMTEAALVMAKRWPVMEMAVVETRDEG